MIIKQFKGQCTAIDKKHETEANSGAPYHVTSIGSRSVVPIVEDVPEVIILPELWRKTSGVVADCPHHVVERGVRRMDVFFSADDRQEYLDLLSQSASKHALDFLAWCLMRNHSHVVVVPCQERSLACTFRRRALQFSVEVGG